MSDTSEIAPAKVNLFLHVVGRRTDGYHLLDSLAVFAGAADRLSATPAPEFTLDIIGPFAPGLPADADNLVLRAARALADYAGVTTGAQLTLEKHLPVASGIGGGSADAAAALRLLTRLWRIPVESGALIDIARSLGADVPVCLPSLPARMRGIGENLEPAPILPPYALVLVNPGVAVATQAVFRARRGDFSTAALLPASWPDAHSMARDLAALRNDLEAPALELCPQIATVLAELRSQPGCLLARMSGSGATCFGLFADVAAAAAAEVAIQQPHWWCWSGAAPPTRNLR